MISVIADDLSGAAELAGVAVRHGLSAEVQTRFEPSARVEVICLDTDTRFLPPAEAARIVGAATREVMAAKPAGIFKKCDSVLRGSVLAEARAMAGSAGRPRIVVLSANPKRGRIIRDGRYFIAGRPLHETDFARDPSHPRTTAVVADLLGGDLTGVTAPDAQSMADVRARAAALDPQTLPVGGADFFDAWLLTQAVGRSAVQTGDLAPGRGPTLLVCGSKASWRQRQGEAEAQGLPVFALPHAAAAVLHALRSSRCVLLGIGDGPATAGLSPARLTGQLAETVGRILRDATVERLLLEGGATAAAVVHAQGWTRLIAGTEAAPGVGVLRPFDLDRPWLFIKPGSYAWPREIWPG